MFTTYHYTGKKFVEHPGPVRCIPNKKNLRSLPFRSTTSMKIEAIKKSIRFYHATQYLNVFVQRKYSQEDNILSNSKTRETYL